MIHSAAITNIGQKRRVNQDSYLVQENPVGNLPDLFVVADGMGGHRAGDYASRFTVERLRTKIESAPETDMRSMVTRVLHEINTELRTIAASDEAYYGMGTTCVLCTIDGSRLQVANIGDSRLYIAGKDGMRQVTVDHSLVEEMVLAGGISEASAIALIVIAEHISISHEAVMPLSLSSERSTHGHTLNISSISFQQRSASASK